MICEKPITLSYGDFETLWETAQRCDRHLIEDHNYRFNEPILAINQLIEDGSLGEIQEVEIRMALDVRNEGGRFADPNLPCPVHQLPAGVIHDVITHMAYLALQYLPSIDRVAAAWSNHGGGDLFKYDDLDAIAIGGSVHARLRFSSHTQPDCFSIIVRGTQGLAETDLFQPYLRCITPRSGGKQLSPLINQWVNGWELINASVSNFRRKVLQQTPYEGLHRLMAQTYSALSSGQAPPISFEDMARTSQLVEALLAQENRL